MRASVVGSAFRRIEPAEVGCHLLNARGCTIRRCPYYSRRPWRRYTDQAGSAVLVAFGSKMQLRVARLCLDCEELHTDNACPRCASESYAFLSNWLHVEERRRWRRPTGKATGSGEGVGRSIGRWIRGEKP